VTREDGDSPGARFRTDVLERYEPSTVSGMLVLDMAAAALDECYRLEEALEKDGILSTGSQHQTIAHPALKELRAHRQSFLKLTAQIEPGPGGSASRAGAALVAARWSK
jgi:hypothetical protein